MDNIGLSVSRSVPFSAHTHPSERVSGILAGMVASGAASRATAGLALSVITALFLLVVLQPRNDPSILLQGFSAVSVSVQPTVQEVCSPKLSHILSYFTIALLKSLFRVRSLGVLKQGSRQRKSDTLRTRVHLFNLKPMFRLCDCMRARSGKYATGLVTC
jgi:hypothetical protein